MSAVVAGLGERNALAEQLMGRRNDVADKSINGLGK
jgi:hypothetical protein